MLMGLQHELRALDQLRFTTDGIHFDSITGQAWMNRVFQERFDELEVELWDAGSFSAEDTFVPPNLETRLGSIPAVTQIVRSSCDQEQRSSVVERLVEAPGERKIHPRRRLVPVNPTETLELPDQKCQLPEQSSALIVFRWRGRDHYLLRGAF